MVNYSSFRKYARRTLPAVGLLALAGFGNTDVSDKAQSIPSDIHLKNHLVQTLKEAEEASRNGNYDKATSNFFIAYLVISEQDRILRLSPIRVATRDIPKVEEIARETYPTIISNLLQESEKALAEGDYMSIAFSNLIKMGELPYKVEPSLEQRIRKVENATYHLGIQKEFEKAEKSFEDGDYEKAINHLALSESYARKGGIELPDGFQELKTKSNDFDLRLTAKKPKNNTSDVMRI